MNQYIKLEIMNELLVTENFVSACKLAATKDDGVIDEEEKKTLAKISKAAERFIKELNKLV